MLSLSNYQKKTWTETFPNTIDVTSLKINNSWKKIFKNKENTKILQTVNVLLNEQLEKEEIFPHPELLFDAFNKTPFKDIKVVILGQDPYHNCINHITKTDTKIVPQAMGLSFSVPKEFKIPSSLKNIYKNLQKYNHITEIPKNGNLEEWANQGCLLLNTSLTVKKSCPNIHTKIWTPFTDSIIKHISDKHNNIVFILWGAPALKKLKLIDDKKHKIVISSHPSGLSCYKTLKEYPAFMNNDCFGETNKYLKELKQKEIIF